MSGPEDPPALARLSARIGADPLLIQGSGGNTSAKEGGTMWIKASGTFLGEAERRAIFVPVDLGAMRAVLAGDIARADRPGEFAPEGAPRPSIETALHAVFPQRIVVHVHSVAAIALAIRANAEAAAASPLAGFRWAFVPYRKSGARLVPGTDVVLLANHGLIVAAETAAGAEALLSRAAGEGYAPAPECHPLHAVALLPDLLAAAAGGSLYPDHAVFCGPGALAAARRPTGLDPPPFLLVSGAGALAREEAPANAQALARCLGDVLARLAEGAAVAHLTPAQEAELLDWDAEKYRRALHAG
jgi:rhamnose utilization protein RhaD (predicted bifunctional aldolase and dehydrogenase)